MEYTQYIYITTNGDISIVDIPSEELSRRVHELIDCELFEIVSLPNYGDLLMIVDETGKLTGKRCNPVASAVYPGTAYGDYIVGDVLIGKVCLKDGTYDVGGLMDPAANYFFKFFNLIKESYYGQ